MIDWLKSLRQYLLTGVSYTIPFIACGGLMIAFAIALVPMTATGPDFSGSPNLKMVLDIGAASFSLMLPVLAGYIAYAVSGKPALVAGFVGGYLANSIKAGFLGALLAGLIAGYVVMAVKRIPVPKALRPVMPILVIPILSAGMVGFLMLKVVGLPIADLMTFLGKWLQEMNAGNAAVLGMILGAMIASDMGGPINKTAFFFGAAMINEGNFAVMGACAAAICVPPLGMGLATLMARRFWSDEERDAGGAALAMGMIGITEGAIPFAAADPVRVIPSIVVGSMVASTIAMLGGVGNHVPHGGPVVLLAIDNRLMYVIAILAGTLVAALMINLLKRFTTVQKTEEKNV
ncbi:MAG: PTS fructose transporter subunit IIC [Pontiellaceae bacterium]|jgi:fructose-specific phosphotransferase system IIC component|nr:PTS fructose transporter subunit IIC [Pontiellaceae bacterium]